MPQDRLAKLVKGAKPDERLDHTIRTLPNLRAVLALALARAWRRDSRKDRALEVLDEVLEEYETHSRPDSHTDRRLVTQMKGDKVRWTEPVNMALFPNIISQCTAILGPTDPYTLSIQLQYALELRNYGQESETESILLSMLQQLREFKSTDQCEPANEVPEQDSQVFAGPLQTEKWIERIERDLQSL